jgi:hypothetical protein
MAIDRMMLDDRIMGGHIEAVLGSVNAALRDFGLRPHFADVRVAYSEPDSPHRARIGPIPPTSSVRFKSIAWEK